MLNLYENNRLQASTGETLRPGGYLLTEKLITRCHFKKGDKILDLGCGNGASLSYLKEEHEIDGTGVDPSEMLLKKCIKKNPQLDCVIGNGEAIPFLDQSFDGVLTECSLSLMDPIEKAVKEIYRVIDRGGYWGISDLYAKKPENLIQLEKKSFNSCIKRLHDLENLIRIIKKIGFKIILLEDESYYLKKLMVDLIFEYGSMNKFWTECSKTDNCGLDKQLKACKPGYFALIVQK